MAAQTLSASVADAIEFLREDLHHPDFAGSEKTTDFIRRIDQLVDCLNSKNPVVRGMKSPMNKDNFEDRKKWLLEMISRFLALKDTNGNCTCSSKRKTPWIGFVITILSTMKICEDLLSRQVNPLQFVCTHKMSRDQLEMLFSRIRQRDGCENDPNCLQFKYALRAIMKKNLVLPSEKANVSMEEPVVTLFLGRCLLPLNSRPMHKSKDLLIFCSQQQSTMIMCYTTCLDISPDILLKIKCTPCSLALHRNSLTAVSTPDSCSSLTERKDQGGLKHPHHDVFRIVKTADRFLRYKMKYIEAQCIISLLIYIMLV